MIIIVPKKKKPRVDKPTGKLNKNNRAERLFSGHQRILLNIPAC